MQKRIARHTGRFRIDIASRVTGRLMIRGVRPYGQNHAVRKAKKQEGRHLSVYRYLVREVKDDQNQSVA